MELTPPATARTLLVDDEPLIRAGLRLILDGTPGIEVVGEAGDGRAGVQAVASLRPHVVLMDLRMPVLDGIAATREIVASGHGAAVVVLTSFDTEGFIADALDAGAQGFLLKNAPPEELIDAVRQAAAGGMPFSPAVLRRVAQLAARAPRPDAADPLAELSDREREVALLIADGLGNQEIADRLYLSLPTVKTYVGRLLGKLDASNRVQIALAVQRARVG
ncbi:MAG: response regulator transcription factor [Micropruina sp.]|uniref:response regulator transcription factor n=1 Tax=Micropruina sp. TaxID=2737536 RepID=UPI0039E4209A